jgi:hypothetical protein
MSHFIIALLCLCCILLQVIMATNRIETLDPALIRPGGVNSNINPATYCTITLHHRNV